MRVEVAYALEKRQRLIVVQSDEPLSVREAIEQSNIMAEFAEIDLDQNRVGVFSQLVKLDDALREGDRVEIYRALTADPAKVPRKNKGST